MPDQVHQEKMKAAWAAAVPGLDVSPMAIFGRLKQVQTLYEAALESLYDGSPLSVPEVDLLILLRHAEQPLIARQLARLRGCSRAAIAKILTKLEGRDLVTREPNPADRRAAFVRITDAGAALIDTIFPRQLAVEVELLAPLGVDARADVVQALDTLIDALSSAA